MFFWITILLILLSISLHELGHAFAMQKRGVGIKEIGLLGMPLPKVPHIRMRNAYTERFFPGTDVCIHPFIIGAYVFPTDEGQKTLEALHPKEQAAIFGAGPLANFLFFCVLAAVSWVCAMLPVYPNVAWGVFVVEFGKYVALFLALWYLRRILYSYLFPIVGAGAFFYVIYLAVLDPLQSVAGPIGIVRIIGKVVPAPEAHVALQYAQAIWVAGLMSFFVGLTNILPLFPFDVGRTVLAYLGVRNEKLARHYKNVTASCFIVLILFAFGADFVRLYLG